MTTPNGTGREIHRKPLSWFKPDPNQPRKNIETRLEELRLLNASLVKKQLLPLLAKRCGTIVDGEFRWRAAMLTGEPASLEVIILSDGITEAEIKAIQLETALHRADLKPYEQYVGMSGWLAVSPGTTGKELAVRLDFNPSNVTRVLSLSKCGKPIQEAAAAGKIGIADWYAMSKATPEQQLEMLAAKLAGASAAQLEAKRRKASYSASAVRMKRIACPVPGKDVKLTLAGEDISLEEAIEAAQEWLKAAKRAHEDGLDAKTFVAVMKDRAKA